MDTLSEGMMRFFFIMVLFCSTAQFFAQPEKGSLKRRRETSEGVAHVLAPPSAARRSSWPLMPEPLAFSPTFLPLRFSDEEETSRLRSFVVVPDAAGSDLDKKLAVILSNEESLLSVKNYFFCTGKAKEIESSCAGGEAYAERCWEWSNQYADELEREFGEGCRVLSCDAAIVLHMPLYGVVFKIPNPFYCYPSDTLYAKNGLKGENRSMRRQVQRVLAAAEINEKCSARGVSAPVKKLYLRPGANLDGSMDDAHLFICMPYIEKDLDKELLKALPDEAIHALLDAVTLLDCADLKDENVFVCRGKAGEKPYLVIIDTEKTYNYKGIDPVDGLVMMDFVHHPLKTRYLLGRKIAQRHIDSACSTRIKLLFDALPPDLSEGDKSACLWSWIKKYLIFLKDHSDLSEVDVAQIEAQWGYAYQKGCLLDAVERPDLFL